jgi:hypothetical protein
MASELALRHAMRHDAARAGNLRERAIAASAAWGALRQAAALRAA